MEPKVKKAALMQKFLGGSTIYTFPTWELAVGMHLAPFNTFTSY